MSQERILPDRTLEFFASKIDDACSSCQKALTPTEIDHSKKSVETQLSVLNTMYSQKNLNTDPYHEAYLTTCNTCLEDGRTGQLTKRYTCGIRVRLWEQPTKKD